MKKIAMPKFSALEQLRKEQHKFEASLIYMSRTCLKKTLEERKSNIRAQVTAE